MKRLYFAVAPLLFAAQNALALEEPAKKMDSTTMTFIGLMALAVALTALWIVYGERREKRRKQRRANKSAA